jgi:hypothetical protein
MRKSLINIVRGIKNKQYDDSEVLVREATSTSDGWPDANLLREINDRAWADPRDYHKIFKMLWKRLVDIEYHRHVIKALLLLDYMIRGTVIYA